VIGTFFRQLRIPRKKGMTILIFGKVIKLIFPFQKHFGRIQLQSSKDVTNFCKRNSIGE
jgi:hypothetical protein